MFDENEFIGQCPYSYYIKPDSQVFLENYLRGFQSEATKKNYLVGINEFCNYTIQNVVKMGRGTSGIN